MIPDYTPVNLTDEADSLMADLIAQALAILDAAGYVVAPKEPTEGQLDAGRPLYGIEEWERDADADPVLALYREMIKARPDVVLKAPTQWDDYATLALK